MSKNHESGNNRRIIHAEFGKFIAKYDPRNAYWSMPDIALNSDFEICPKNGYLDVGLRPQSQSTPSPVSLGNICHYNERSSRPSIFGERNKIIPLVNLRKLQHKKDSSFKSFKSVPVCLFSVDKKGDNNMVESIQRKEDETLKILNEPFAQLIESAPFHNGPVKNVRFQQINTSKCESSYQEYQIRVNSTKAMDIDFKTALIDNGSNASNK
jgi:hypothetical protein